MMARGEEGLLIALSIVILFFALASVDWDAIDQAYEAHLLELRQERFEVIRKNHPSWTIEDCELITDKKIRLGMTDEMVRLSWGRPSDINRSVGVWGVHEQWIYRIGEYTRNYLYFRNGILTSWQT